MVIVPHFSSYLQSSFLGYVLCLLLFGLPYSLYIGENFGMVAGFFINSLIVVVPLMIALGVVGFPVFRFIMQKLEPHNYIRVAVSGWISILPIVLMVMALTVQFGDIRHISKITVGFILVCIPISIMAAKIYVYICRGI